MSTSLSVSIIMSVYDGDNSEWFANAVDSILEQTYRKFELIIVLSGITRVELLRYANSYKKIDSRVVLIVQEENLGFPSALNEAITSSKSDILVRMDSDDISHRDRIKKLADFLYNNPGIDVVGSFVAEFRGSDPARDNSVMRYPCGHDAMKDLFVRRNPLAHGSVAFRRRFFDRAGYYPLFSVRNEDTLLWLSGFIAGCRFANIPDVIYYVRVNDDMARRRIGIRKSFSDLLDRLRVIVNLRGRPYSYVYAIAMFLVQNLPASIYGRLRGKVVYR